MCTSTSVISLGKQGKLTFIYFHSECLNLSTYVILPAHFSWDKSPQTSLSLHISTPLLTWTEQYLFRAHPMFRCFSRIQAHSTTVLQAQTNHIIFPSLFVFSPTNLSFPVQCFLVLQGVVYFVHYALCLHLWLWNYNSYLWSCLPTKSRIIQQPYNLDILE